MSDGAKSNLEPIDESDLKLKEKFIGGGESVKKEAEKSEETEAKIVEIHPVEKSVERKEGSAEKEAAYSKILSKIGARKQDLEKDEVAADAKAANAGIDAENKIKILVVLAETKGIPHAVKVARHMEDNYTLDEFHDKLLAEELHNALVKKGMIKEI